MRKGKTQGRIFFFFRKLHLSFYNIPVSLFCPPQLRKIRQEMCKPQKGVGLQGTGLRMAMEKRDNKQRRLWVSPFDSVMKNRGAQNALLNNWCTKDLMTPRGKKTPTPSPVRSLYLYWPSSKGSMQQKHKAIKSCNFLSSTKALAGQWQDCFLLCYVKDIFKQLYPKLAWLRVHGITWVFSSSLPFKPLPQLLLPTLCQ